MYKVSLDHPVSPESMENIRVHAGAKVLVAKDEAIQTSVTVITARD